MVKLNYSNYLKDKDFDIEKKYLKKLILCKFEKPKSTAKNKTIIELYNNTNIFKREHGNDRKKISLLRIYRYFIDNNTFEEISLKEIVLAKPDDLIRLINKIGKIESKSTLYKIITDIFNYTNKFQSNVITSFFTENFNFRTCFYCNKDFINNFEKTNNSYSSTFQLDHFYDKGKYPYLALSLYNFIPSCSTCNSSTVKGTLDCFEYDSRIGKFNNESCISPNDKNFNFENKVKFKLFLDKNCKNLHVKDKEHIDISLKEQFSDEYDKYIEVFKLDKRYKAHKDIVYDMLIKAEQYPESRLKELQDLSGIPYQQIKKDIFNLIDENEDLSKKPFSKLIKDIIEELKLV